MKSFKGFQVGDVRVLLDGVLTKNLGVRQDLYTAGMRAAYRQALQDTGEWDPKDGSDPGRALILPLLERQWVFANNPTKNHPFAYSVINGQEVPKHLIHLFDTIDVKTVIMASAGYPNVLNTLSESEALLKRLSEQDPNGDRIVFQMRNKQSSGVWDDRSYLRVVRTDCR